MAIVFHHNDDDGRCAAAIVILDLLPMYAIRNVKTYEYGYRKDFDIQTAFEDAGDDVCYIVDLSIDDNVFAIIKEAVSRGMKVVYIDHHKTTIDRIAKMTDEDKLIMDKITQFVKTDLSATMLTWIYSCMNDSQREHPCDVNFSFSPTFTHVNIENKGIMKIPSAVFYIDDYDIWRHSDPDTMCFHFGFSIADREWKESHPDSTVSGKNPKSELWSKLLYEYGRSDQLALEYVQKGKAIQIFKNSEDEFMRKRGTVKKVEIDGTEYSAFILNYTGGTTTFGEKLNECDVCVMFSFDHRQNCWVLSIRSGEESKFDCAEFAMKHGGGGHPHAAGCAISKLDEIPWLIG